MIANWKTAVIGVTPNENRYAFKAVTKLTENEFPVVALGFRSGEVAGHSILMDWPKTIEGLKVVTMYIGPARQPDFYDYIIGLNPKKVIFNPGTENEEFYKKLEQHGIEFEEACTLVLLSTNSYADGI
jgi:predicted CoA-binding protein